MSLDKISSAVSASIVCHYHGELKKSLPQWLDQKRFWWIGDDSAARVMLYDSSSRLLWDANPNKDANVNVVDAKKQVAGIRIGGISGWRLPLNQEIIDFSKLARNPFKSGSANRLLRIDFWCTSSNRIDLDNFNLSGADSAGRVLACNDFLADADPQQVIQTAIEKSWSLRACDVADAPDLMQALHELNYLNDLQLVYQDVDYLSARLPRLDASQFTDPNKGLWEFWGMEADLLAQQGLRARNPALDLRDCNVAIDFGTSSTVVAYDDNDQHKLLRIGVANYWEQDRPEHYENPTVLEFLDFKGLLDVWRSEAYRPGVSWDQVRCSHAALQNFRDNKGEPRVVASVLAKIKHWALREAESSRLRLTDRSEPAVEHELAALTLRNPVRGQALTVSEQDPFDPIELYAWFLGLNINWRGRGIFPRYYMTFPVAYPREVKDKILASFRRGLQRSLPATLVGQSVFQQFTVEERASEPAAYAASAMPFLGIAPTADGVAYAVFDFGGGTTDFDFGLYRLPTAEEEDEGKEEVFEHFGAAGDKFLGGENLLENLAYRVFRHNLDLCRKHKIVFTRPLDAENFAGSEMFLEQTQAASTNTVMLMAVLRPLLEQGRLESSTGMVSQDLLDREGKKIPCQLEIPLDALTAYLEQRIEHGVCNFLAALRKAFGDQLSKPVHVLLAGNASRSDWVLTAFGALDEDYCHDSELVPLQERILKYAGELFAGALPALIVRMPLPVDADNPFMPTAKTGVALGLLRLCPGSPVKVINRAADSSADDAPFAHYVGRIRQGKFQVGIAQGSAYGQWHEIGVPSEGVFNLYHTQSPHAHSGEMRQGEPGLYKQRLDLLGSLRGQKVLARVAGPTTIELCTAASLEAVERGDSDNVMTLNLGQ